MESVPPAVAAPRRLVIHLVRPGLILLTLGVALLSILLLAGTLTQSRITGVSVGGIKCEHFEILRRSQTMDRFARPVKSKNQRSRSYKSDSNALNIQNWKFQEQYTPARINIDSQLAAYAAYISVIDQTIGGRITNAKDFSPVERLNYIDFNVPNLKKIHPEIDQKTFDQKEKDIDDAGAAYREVDKQRIELKSKIDTKKDQDIRLTQEITDIRTSLDGVFDNFAGKLDQSTKARIENSFFELYADGGIGHWLNKFILAPPDILTLLLVVCMGVLGSVLQMTHALFVDNRAQSLGAYALRLSVGAITALVIFIVTKAGVPLVADAARFGGDAPINPFFVSFLAIISGLMSENAISFVENQGIRVFAPSADDNKLRWARNDLHDAFGTAGRTTEALRQLVDADNEQFEDWLSGKTAMPADIQKIVAGTLGSTLRDLFTDLPPEDANPKAAKT